MLLNAYRFPSEAAALPPVDRAVAIGVFDGVHLAHRAVIGQVVAVEGLTPTVLTFSDSPHTLPKSALPIEPDRHKQLWLSRLGIEQTVEMEFSAVRSLSPAQFVRDVLHGALRAKRVACGENFRFGAEAAGDVTLLTALCRPLGIEVLAVPTVLDGDEPISSARIRRLLAEGEMQEASRLLGHSYGITAPVTAGNRLGRTAGFPTLNQPLPPDAALPKFGVYASVAVVDGKSYVGVTNIGIKPTVGADTPLAETHLLDFAEEAYGKEITVYPVRLLREERQFADTDALFAQVAADVAAVREMYRPQGTIRAVLFDFDDTLHSRVEAWRQFSVLFVNRLFPDAPQEERDAKAHALWEAGGCGRGFWPRDNIDIPYRVLFEDIKQRWGLSHDTEELIRLCHRLFAPCVQVFADTVPTLRRLRAAGLKVGILTNGHSFLQNRKLYHAALAGEVDAVVVAGDEGVQKPNPELFRRVAWRMGLPTEDCVYVGDNPRADIAGATAAAMQTRYLDRFGERLLEPRYDDLNGILNSII